MDEGRPHLFEFGKYAVFFEKIEKDDQKSTPDLFVSKPSLTNEFLNDYIQGRTNPFRVILITGNAEEADALVPKDQQIDVLSEGLGKYNQLSTSQPKVFIIKRRLVPDFINAVNTVVADVCEYQVAFPREQRVPTVFIVDRYDSQRISLYTSLCSAMSEWRLGKFSVILYTNASAEDLSGSVKDNVMGNPYVVVHKTNVTKLMLKQFDGPEIAYVTKSDAGDLQITSLIPELQSEIEEQLHRYSGRPLELFWGEDNGSGGCSVIISNITPADPRYLSALGDNLQKDQVLIQGKRLHCWTIEE